MNFFKQDFNDDFDDFTRQAGKKSKNQHCLLERITEVNESEVLTQVDKDFLTESSSSEVETAPKTANMFFCAFINKLKSHSKIFQYFIQTAFTAKILEKNQVVLTNSCLTKKQTKKTIKFELISQASDMRVDLSEDFLKDRMRIKHSITPIPMRSQDDRTSPSPIRRSGFMKKSNAPLTKLDSLKPRKKNVLNPQSVEIKEIFNKICAGAKRITSDLFLEFLLKKYPLEIADVISKYFDFKSAAFEDYISEMARFINLPNEKHLSLCFEIFDLNRDKYICFKDAFRALEILKSNFCVDDLSAISDSLMMKKEGNLPKFKLRRRSTFSLLKESLEKKKMIPKETSIKKTIEAPKLDFNEFKVVQFQGRPQIIRNFIKYASNYDYDSEISAINIKRHIAKESEIIVDDMNISSDYRDLMQKNDKYNYYCLLDIAMSLYSKTDLDNMLEKFKFLQSSEIQKFKTITKDSMISKFPALFGFQNDYFSTRFYNYLSEGQYLTKAKFLTKMHSLQKSTSSVIVNRLAFDLYDYKKDNKLTVDEIYHMFEALPIGSPAYKECLLMVNVFVDSIFDRNWSKVVGIDFQRYEELTDVSCIGFEVMEFIKSPLKALIGRRAVYFEPHDKEIHNRLTHAKTRTSILVLIT